MPEQETHSRAKSVREFLKVKSNQLLIALIGLTVLLRLYYFFNLGNQPIWWDEGDYLAIAKVWANGMPTPEWWSHFTGIRPLLLPLIWAAMFKVGFGELALRFITILIPSILSVWVCYQLGKDLYNKYVGLMAGLMMSSYWVFTFYSFRLLTDIPAVFFGLLSFYFFWSQYIKRHKPYGLYLCFLFGVIAFSIRFPLALVPITCVLYLAITRRTSLIKDKTIWKGVAWGIVFMIPYLIYFIINKFALFRFYFGDRSVHAATIPWVLIKDQLTWLESGWFVALILGLASLYTLILYFDIIIKQKKDTFNADVFVFLWVIVHLFFYLVIFKGYTDRWLLMMVPALFIIASKGLTFLYDIIARYQKVLALGIVLLILFGGFYQNFVHSNNLIIVKQDSYAEVKLGGLWLKEHSNPTDKIFTSSVVQNQYYSERDSYDLRSNGTIWDSCTDIYGAVNKNESCQKGTQASFDEKVARVKPKYLIVSVFEPVFTPDWAYTYGETHNLTLVQGYRDQRGNPTLIIYQFPN